MTGSPHISPSTTTNSIQHDPPSSETGQSFDPRDVFMAMWTCQTDANASWLMTAIATTR